MTLSNQVNGFNQNTDMTIIMTRYILDFHDISNVFIQPVCLSFQSTQSYVDNGRKNMDKLIKAFKSDYHLP